jgi:hypothetical protein
MFEAVLVFTCAVAFVWKLEIEARTDETINIAKIVMTRIFLGIGIASKYLGDLEFHIRG